jgi:hypothetical protein
VDRRKCGQTHGLSFAIMRVVLDSSTFELPPAALLPFTPSGGNDIEAILGSVAHDPWQIPALLKLASWSEKAMGTARSRESPTAHPSRTIGNSKQKRESARISELLTHETAEAARVGWES